MIFEKDRPKVKILILSKSCGVWCEKVGFKYFSRRLFLILISVIFQRLITVKVFETEIEHFEGHSDF